MRGSRTGIGNFIEVVTTVRFAVGEYYGLRFGIESMYSRRMRTNYSSGISPRTNADWANYPLDFRPNDNFGGGYLSEFCPISVVKISFARCIPSIRPNRYADADHKSHGRNQTFGPKKEWLADHTKLPCQVSLGQLPNDPFPPLQTLTLVDLSAWQQAGLEH